MDANRRSDNSSHVDTGIQYNHTRHIDHHGGQEDTSTQSACPYRIDIGNWSEYRHIGPIMARRLSDIKT